MLNKSYTFSLPIIFAGLISGFYAFSAQAINPNTASAEELADELIGVGPKLAVKIVEFRELNGEYQGAEDLMLVNGIGSSVIDKNEALLEFEE